MNPGIVILAVFFTIMGLICATKAGRRRFVFFFLDNGDIERSRNRELRRRAKARGETPDAK
jgi:hypothetical protein